MVNGFPIGPKSIFCTLCAYDNLICSCVELVDSLFSKLNFELVFLTNVESTVKSYARNLVFYSLPYKVTYQMFRCDALSISTIKFICFEYCISIPISPVHPIFKQGNAEWMFQFFWWIQNHPTTQRGKGYLIKCW